MRCTGRSHGAREADGPSSEGLPSARAPARGVRAANDPVGWPPRGSLPRAHVGQRPKHRTKPADFDSQARAMRFIGAPRSEGARDERVRRDVSRPRFAQRACEREQHRTPGERTLGLVDAPIRRRRRTSRYRAYAALTRSPCASSVARAASSAFAGQPRSREASATSASATMHLARATASLGPKARAARRRRAFARTRSPSCAIAMPRSARAGASSRRATRFNAPRGSPAARARAAAVISESIGIPSHLSLPPFRYPALNVSHDQRPSGRIEGRRRAMTKHMTGTRNEWLAARLELLEAEKELTRRSDELAQRRQELPWVRIDKEYRFETDEGSASLADLFRGRSQLLVYHFMFGPDYKAGCPSCSAIADGFDGSVVHLANHDVTLLAVSRAPLAKLQAFKRRMGWTFPWASSFGREFNFDFNVSVTEKQQREGTVEYNYERGGHALDAKPEAADEGPVAAAAMTGTDVATYTRERPGMGAFALEHGVVYHAYSAYARGLDGLWGMYQWLDRAPRGRNETGVWWRRHDEYDKG